MSDLIDESAPDSYHPGFCGEKVTVRVGAHGYLFEVTNTGSLKYLSHSPSVIMDDDDDDDEPFDLFRYDRGSE